MSTSVIRPGVATKQTPSGKKIVMLVAGVAVAIAVGFAFYTSQSQDVTVSGVESQAGPTVTDTWLVNRQSAVNSANDEAAAYETARMTAMGESYAASEAAKFDGVTDSWLIPLEASQVAAREAANAAETARLTGQAEAYANSQPSVSAAAIIEQSIQEELAAHQQAQMEAQGEFFGVVELLGTDRVTQASTDRLTGLANATVGPQAEALLELEDHFMVAEIKGSQQSSNGPVHPLTEVPVVEVDPSGPVHPLTYTPR